MRGLPPSLSFKASLQLLQLSPYLHKARAVVGAIAQEGEPLRVQVRYLLRECPSLCHWVALLRA
jgi:hypothetical protein